MAKVSFTKPGLAAPAGAQQPVVDVAATVTPAPATAAPAPAPAAPKAQAFAQPVPPTQAVAPVPPTQAVSTPFNDEAIDIRDIVIPRLTLVQRTGDLSAIFRPGDIVISEQGSDNKFPISMPHEADAAKEAARKPIELVVFGFMPKRYVERVEGGVGGDMANTVQEVVQRGGTTEYNEHKATGKPWYQTLATAVCLVRQPEWVNEPESFPLEFGEARFALALWSMKGAAYTKGAKIIYTARSKYGHLKDGYLFGSWLLDTDPNHKAGDFIIVAPKLQRGNPTTPEFRAWAESIFQ